jgi:hypothetical protein
MIEALAAQVDGALSTSVARASSRLPRIDLLRAPSAGARFDSLIRALIAELSTSGSTGPGKAVPKALRHLDREVEALEALLGPRLGKDARVFATVSQQHLYGLLIRVLWPLAAGRAFCADTNLHSEELFPRCASTLASPVTTPVHLRRMRADAGFRSFAPARASSRRAAARRGRRGRNRRARRRRADRDLGSTETGGVGWRQQTRAGENAAFRAFPNVSSSSAEPGLEGQLVVRSPYAIRPCDGRARAGKQTLMGIAPSCSRRLPAAGQPIAS